MVLGKLVLIIKKDTYITPKLCGSVGWASSCKAASRQFDSLVRAHAWVGALVRGWAVCEKLLIDVSLSHVSVFLPPLPSL